MAVTIEPPKKRKKSAAAPTPPPPPERSWLNGVIRSGYFFAAVLLHLLLFLILYTWVIFQPPTPPPDDFTKTYVPPSAPAAPPPPPPSVVVPTTVSNPTDVITTVNPTTPTFTVPIPEINATPTDTVEKITTPSITSPSNNVTKRWSSIKGMEQGKWGRSLGNIADSNGDPHNVIAKFPVYLAQYADGDWKCNVHLVGGQIDAGSLPDLVAKINEWSSGNLKGEVIPTPLDIASPDLLDKMPPFIFMTGHKDFTLTDGEIENLRTYLQNGGCIWGDNALAGSGSRFDVAFKREMKRVIPDADKNFEDLSIGHPIFTHSWFNITEVPQGMNYFAEPLQHIDIDGKIAILYTPNDYSDLFFLRILPGDKAVQNQYAPADSPLFSYGTFFDNSAVLFRNFNLDGALPAHRLGMNIVGYLLVRFDKEMMLAP